MKTLLLFLALSLSAVAQECSSPQTTNFQDGSVSISYTCLIVHPGQNSPFTESDTLTAQVVGPRVFSSVAVSYQSGYFMYGPSNAMSLNVTLPDITRPGAAPQFNITGSGQYSQTASGPFSYPAQDVFRINQVIALTGYIVAVCSAYCGYSIVITLNP